MSFSNIFPIVSSDVLLGIRIMETGTCVEKNVNMYYPSYEGRLLENTIHTKLDGEPSGYTSESWTMGRKAGKRGAGGGVGRGKALNDQYPSVKV